MEDTHIWCFLNSGNYSAKLHTMECFLVPSSLDPGRGFGNPGLQENEFFMWLVAHNRCWTADRLLQRGLPHPAHCPLCDQADETINHLLVPAIFAREFWFLLLQRLSLQGLSHKMKMDALMTGKRWLNPGWMVRPVRKGLNVITVLGAWIIWKHCNRC